MKGKRNATVDATVRKKSKREREIYTNINI